MSNDHKDRLHNLLHSLCVYRGVRGDYGGGAPLYAGFENIYCIDPALSEERVEDNHAVMVYGMAFEDGFVAALHRFKVVLGLPEARGREREAIELALDPEIEPATVAVRLRAAATSPFGGGTGKVIPFQRRLNVGNSSSEEKPD